MRATPSLLRLTKAVGGDASAAAAMSAAIFGPADAASSDQPAVSRTLTKSTGALRPAAAAAAANTAVSCVQPTVSGAAPVAMALNWSSSARHRRLAVAGAPPQPRRSASASGGVVPSQVESKIFL